MQTAIVSLIGLALATEVAACFAPARPTEGGPLVQGEQCRFEEAGNGGLTWFGGPAYKLRNGLVAQTVAGFGYCWEDFFRGTLIVDCAQRKSTLVRDYSVTNFSASDDQFGPSLPKYLTDTQRAGYDAILSHPRISQIDVLPLWSEETGAQPDPFCGCTLADIPMNLKG